jgi:FKBP-type peptidyl-prolyl cis-trans isomerase
MGLRLGALLLGALASSCALLERGPESYPSLVRASGLGVQELVVPDGPTAQAGDTVTVHYHGTLESGEVFDSTVERGQPVTFVLGAGQVPPGLDEGVQGMHLYGRRRLTAPIALMFPDGPPEGIPEGRPVRLDVELIALE